MSLQKAVVHVSKGVSKLRTDAPIPKLTQDNYFRIKTKAVALNPTDWKSIESRTSPGATVGCDYSGIVEEVGKDVTTFKVGDRVAGLVRGADPNDHTNGAFAEQIKGKIGPHLKLTSDVSFEDAATLGVGVTTVGQALYQNLGLPLPPNKVQEPTPILIYGASTATGTLAVQYAKLSGLEVYTTSSPHNFDLLRKLGADHVFDYKDPEVGAKIRKATDGKLKLVFDCISEHGSFDVDAAAIGSGGGHVATLLAVSNFPRKDVVAKFTVAYTAIGEDFSEAFPASQTDYEFASKFWNLTEDLFNSGKIKAHPTEVRDGLEGVTQGLQDLKDGNVSGVKLVFRVN